MVRAGKTFALLLFLLAANPSVAKEICDIDVDEVGYVFPREKFRALLQHFADRVQGIGFRHLGDPGDFDHGHVLYRPYDENGTTYLRPFAILWHTQERAYDFHRSDPGGPYDYLHSLRRNWLQFFDGDDSSTSEIYNALALVRESFPDRMPYQRYVSDDFPNHHSVHATMLDFQKFPPAWKKDYDFTTVYELVLYFHRISRDFAPDGATNPQYDIELRDRNGLSADAFEVRRQEQFSDFKPLAGELELKNDAIPREFLSSDPLLGPL